MEIHPENIYPQVTFPVAKDTPMLSSLVGWNHDTSWKVPKPNSAGGKSGGGGDGGDIIEVVMNEKNFVVDHVLDGKILYPAMGYLHLAWQTFAKSMGSDMANTPVVLSLCQIHNASVLPLNGSNPYNNLYDMIL